MHRIVLFSSFAFNPNLDSLLQVIFPKEMESKKFGYLPANGVDHYDPGIIDYWKSTAIQFGASFELINNDPAQSNDELEKEKEKIQTLNILMISEGDAFTLIENLKKTGLDQYIISFWHQKNCILTGFSEGAVVLTPNMCIYKYIPRTKDLYVRYPNTKLNGLGLVNYSVFPHYDKYRHKPIIEAYRAKYENEIKALPDFHWYIYEN